MEPGIEETALQQGLFTMDILREGDAALAVPGWTDGERWNGWETPLFERGAADRLLAALEGAGMECWYEPGLDRYVVLSPEYDGEDIDEDSETVEVFHGQDGVGPDGRTMRVYPIGTRLWCWEGAASRSRTW